MSHQAMFGAYSFVNHVLSHHPGVETGFEVPTVLERVHSEWPQAEVSFAAGCEVDSTDESQIAEAAFDAGVPVFLPVSMLRPAGSQPFHYLPTQRGGDIDVAQLTVTNTGQRAGEHGMQLFGRDVRASVNRPVAQLLAYHPQGGESVTGYLSCFTVAARGW